MTNQPDDAMRAVEARHAERQRESYQRAIDDCWASQGYGGPQKTELEKLVDAQNRRGLEPYRFATGEIYRGTEPASAPPSRRPLSGTPSLFSLYSKRPSKT
jgi:hypothetical protein